MGLYMCRDSDHSGLVDGATLNYNLVATAATNQRRFFTTTRGFIGLTNPGTQKGDTVCLLRGAATPFIFRSHYPPSLGTRTWEICWMKRGVLYPLFGLFQGVLDSPPHVIYLACCPPPRTCNRVDFSHLTTRQASQ